MNVAARLGTYLVVIGAVAAASCGGSESVDAVKAEQGIENSLSTSTTKVAAASCPDNVKKEKDSTFTCTVELDGGGEGQVVVTQTSAHNTFSYAFKPGSVKLPGSTVDRALEQDLAASGITGPTVNCPSTVSVVVGKTVTCPFTTSSGRQGDVSFTFSSASGSVNSSSVKTS
jgi:hypothetical protein